MLRYGLIFALLSPSNLQAQVQIAAAASLSDVLPKVQALWKMDDGKKLKFTFDATSRLARQIKEGMSADAIFSADEEWIDYLVADGKISVSDKQPMLENALVMIAPAKTPFETASAKNFPFAKLERLALAGETVPAGKYAMAALMQLNVWSGLERKVTFGDNVRTVLNWVATGEVPMGMVYYSDAVVAGDKVKVVVSDFNGLHPDIVYYAGIIKSSKNKEIVQAFFDFCRGPKAQEIFTAAGFKPVHKKQ